jgi:hypothetical protein
MGSCEPAKVAVIRMSWQRLAGKENGMATGRTSMTWARSARGRVVLLAAVFCLTGHANASDKVPAEIAALLPAAATLGDGSWGVFETEFGKTFSANMHARFPKFSSSCDFTIGPELRVEIKGDTAWEEPPMLDMMVQMFEADVAQARTSLPEHVARLRKNNGHVKTVGTLQNEQVPGGHIVAMEYTEDCAGHPKGTNTVLRGFARKGATQLKIDLWISTGMADAKVMAKTMIDRFQKLNFKPLISAK